MSFEQLVICHCAPVLRGIKVSNLVSCSKQDFPFVKREADNLNKRFEPFGLKCSVLCECKNFSLVFVYDCHKLEKFLNEHDNREYLESVGYSCVSTECMLSELAQRIDGCQEFPHEIGSFLGYPIEDVVGFTRNHGANFKYSGYWKVYGDIRKAKALFESFDLCSRKCSKLAMKGFSIEEVINYADLDLQSA